jgi:hypothetical protein
MKLEDVFHGFNTEKQKLYENFLVDSGVDHAVIKNAQNKVKEWSKDQWLEQKREGDQIHMDLVQAINQHLSPASPEVQAIIRKHYQLTTRFWTPTRESYIGLSQLYGSHPDFV